MLLECRSLGLCGHLFSFAVLPHWNLCVGVCCGNLTWAVLPIHHLDVEAVELHQIV